MQGATVRAAVRMGPAGDLSPVAFEQTRTQTTHGLEDLFRVAATAGLRIDPSQIFVLEVQATGNSSSTSVRGSRAPAPGEPLRTEPLYLSLEWTAGHDGGQTRLSFRTCVVEDPPPVPSCAGDGSGTHCFCGTACAPGANAAGASVHPGPGDLSVSLRGLVAAPGTRRHPVCYRNATSFCSSATFHLTSGRSVDRSV